MRSRLVQFILALSVATSNLIASPVLALELDNLPELVAGLGEPRDASTAQHLTGVLGGIFINTSRYAGSDERVSIPLPLVYINYDDRFYWSVASIGGWLIRSNDRTFRFGLTAKVRGQIHGSDTPYAGITDREGSVDAGLKLEWRIRDVVFGVSWLQDALGHNQGQTANLRLSVPLQLGERWITTPSVGAEWLDQRMVDHYYGVTPTETGGGAPLYTGAASTNLRAGWSLHYHINHQWKILTGLSYTRLGAGIADSPLAVRSDNLLAYASLMWTFGGPR